MLQKVILAETTCRQQKKRKNMKMKLQDLVVEIWDCRHVLCMTIRLVSSTLTCIYPCLMWECRYVLSILVCLVSSTLICPHPSAVWDYRHVFSVTDRLVSSTVTCIHHMIRDCNVALSVTVILMNSTVVQSVLSQRPQQWFRWQFLIQQLIVQCVPPCTLSEVRNMQIINVAQLIRISYGAWMFFALFTRAVTEPYYCQFEHNSLLCLQSTGLGGHTPHPCRFTPGRDPVPIV